MKSRRELLLTLPSLGWLGVFFALPCVLIVALAFRESDLRGGVGEGWTLATVRLLVEGDYLAVVWSTLWMSMVTTVLCMALALPVCWALARMSAGWRQGVLLLVVVPFLTNFIIRIFAWRSLLHPEGVIKQGLVWLGLATDDTMLLNNAGAVLLVMVYTQLPFAILPLYAAAEKFDFSLVDAARDLGATKWQAFRKVFIPGIWRGLISAVVIVFVCSLGQYVIPKFVGGTGNEMIGNKIEQRAFSDRNLPLASALSGALLLVVLVPTLLLGRRRE
ncbi:spermidine/putrescine transport system permease protein [Prosthecobacter fusiformis]|uniref:Spermidine/putrescine transport system permease protein n=1 Tax=Prosthecobacter fusiformis TaxID=48464 RepID=A0A4V3FI70_9BACT|nr:ABC transporter permease [Prosthecobacter fusiformis]TDU81283.1 spermidine/putrescine transport system permease protein [Prosthecobacter fusiformis]